MSFSSLLINTVDVVSVSGTDRHGTPQYATTASGVSARVEFGNRFVVSADGENVVADFTAFIPTVTGVNAGDHVIYDGSRYILLDVRKHQDNRGDHHYELIGRTWKRTS